MKPINKLPIWLSVLGPGLLVMLADTDAGSMILSAQSGAVWGYKLLLLQIILVPVLFIAQEIAVRLGLATGMGHGELIKKYFGNRWALLSVSTLVVCCIGALLTEFSGLAAVSELFHIPVWQTLTIVVSFLIIMAWTGSYASVERVAIFLGLFELIFLYIAWRAQPSPREMLNSMVSMPWHNGEFLYLAAGNIGAVIMPWMIFFQQSAVLDKGLTIEHIKPARLDTFIGAIITQIIMASLLIITAATIGKTSPNTPLDTIGDISHAITPFVGMTTGRILFALGMAGGAMVATIVVSLTTAWGVGEVMGFRRSLEDHPLDAPWFYGIYTIILNLVKLSVAIEVMNALLLPIVLGFLFLLARRAIPTQYRLQGWYGILVGFVLLATSLFGFISGVCGSLFL
jgi:Mn2+/Fe2+ NRAMP family transporter